MKTFKLGAACAASAIAMFAASPAHAQFTELPQIVVTPNRAPTEAERSGSRVETVTRMEMEEQDLPLAVDYLERLPGISISSPGGVGQEGSLSVRGAPRRYVKTLYNGIDIGDPTSPQVQTSYQYLLSGGLDSIEVLKGSQSTLYGSDAIAGVISFSTLGDIEPGVSHILHGEAGSRGTVRGGYGLRAANDAGRAAVNITGFRTDGISAAAAGTERDGYENVTFDAAGDYRINDMLSVFGSLFYIDAEAEYDDDFAFPRDDDPFGINRNISKQKAGRVGFNLDLLDGRLKNQFSVQGFEFDRQIRSASLTDTAERSSFDADYLGKRVKFDWNGSYEVTDTVVVQYGADHERQSAEISTISVYPPWPDSVSNFKEDHSLTGVWTQVVVDPIEDLTLTGGLRHDEHSQFGGYTTYRATGSYRINDHGTRIHSSVGSGFRAPSLYELYSPPGDPTLQPETSLSFDFGVEQTFFGGRAVADITFFSLDIDDLIINDDSTGFVYDQIIGTSTHRGVEASFIYRASGSLSLGAAYTYTEAKNPDDQRLIRVPRHEVALSAAYKPAEKWTIAGSAKFVADTLDSDNFKLDDYVLLNAKVSYQATESTELYVRGENLLDQDYQTVRGYNTPGIGVFAGFRSKF